MNQQIRDMIASTIEAHCRDNNECDRGGNTCDWRGSANPDTTDATVLGRYERWLRRQHAQHVAERIASRLGHWV